MLENERIGVYRGQRLSDGVPVIARALRARYPEAKDMARMRRDFEISSLLKINGILPALGLYPYGAGLAIVFQDMGGIPLVAARDMGAPNLPGFLHIALGIARILADLHKNRIVHKDLNPHNILLNEKTNELRITEFGISSTLTRENPVLLTPDRIEGTLAYISPEQTGRMNRTVDYRADFYSLGITFYQILTGKLPFTSTDPMELVHAHIARDIPEVKQAGFGPVPGAVQSILKKLTAKNAEDRYRSATGLIRDLEECARQVQETGKINDFAAGERDFSEAFQIPQKLYGRDKEREALLSAFERVCEGETVFTLVSGRSGAGKTVLIQEILGPMTERKGYFTSGKFDQHRRDVPYSALIAAFEELIRQLLTESRDKLQIWKERLVASFGANGQVLLEVIPDLQLIVGEQAPVPDLPPTESRNRFHIVFQNFIRTFASREHPLTLFLDDLQWADGATLSLLKVLLTDPDSRYLLLVGSFRDNEVTDAHPLALALEDLQRNGIKPLDLKLSLLGPRDVRLLVADSLALPPDKTSLADDLAETVFKKTDGNPFFTGEFLKSLYQENLIFFSESVGHFSYDMFKIRAQVATDDLVRIISSNIRHLSSTGQDLIRLAACLGGHFDLKTFSLCAEQTQARAAGELEELLVEGFIVAMDDSYKYAAFSNGQNELVVQYKFIHDQVHNAAYQQLAEDDKRQTHLKIARTLLANLPFVERDERILEIVHHMNQGRELILEPDERIRLIELNLQAGKKARDASAYEEALRLFGVAFDAMPANALAKHYDLFIKTHSELGEINYILGENKVAERHFAAILEKAKTALEKVRVYELKIALHAARGEQAEAIRLGIEVLSLLGMKIPAKPGSSGAKGELASAARALSGKSPERLVDTHLMEHQTELAAMRVLMQIATPAYGTNTDLFAVLISRMILHSLKHGNAPASAYAYAAYAMLLCGDLSDTERGYRYGRLALDLVEKLQARDIKCRVYYLYAAGVHHWKHPASESAEYLLHAYQAGLETGDLEYVAAVIFLLTCSPLWIGHKPLREISQEIERFGNPLYRTGQRPVMQLVNMARQFISNLQGGSRNRARLSGERFREEDFADAWQTANNHEGLFYLNFFKTILADSFDQHEAALDLAKKAALHGMSAQGSLALPVLDFHRALALCATIEVVKPGERKRLMDDLEQLAKTIKERATHAPENFKHQDLLISAERARLAKQHGTAIGTYDEAIKSAAAGGFIFDEALSNEAAGNYYVALDQRKFALLYMREARRLYLKLDITAKAEELENHFPELVRNQTNDAAVQSSGPRPADLSGSLDLGTVIKAAATLSGEIQLNGLLDKMLRIAMENAGAQKGALIMESGGNLVVAAAGNALNNTVQILDSVVLESYSMLPATIVRLAERTRQAIVLDEAAADGRFRDDPYVREYRPRSVLCMPVLLQGKLTSLLYLENNGAPGVFNVTRLQTLQVLSAQMATSLENAILYRNIEAALEQEKKAKQAQIEINEAISRFVPAEFLRLLGRDNIVGVELGENIAREMTVLFSDIRQFTTISESMTPEQNFKFINSYLKQVGPAVREHKGFIDKYIGDAIMALFDSPDQAIAASIDMFRVLETWNRGRALAGYILVKIGIGIHTGDLMLGTIGEQSRMEGTVISDSVNLASRLEGLTKYYGASLIISGKTHERLKEPEKLSLRTLDRVRVKGKKDPVVIIEVLNAEPEEIRLLKEATRADFEAGQAAYLNRDFPGAARHFYAVAKKNQKDRAAAVYYKRCKALETSGVPDDWDGVESMYRK